MKKKLNESNVNGRETQIGRSLIVWTCGERSLKFQGRKLKFQENRATWQLEEVGAWAS